MRRYPDLTTRRTVAYVGAYPPCVTATAMFTMDLLSATDLYGWQSVVIAVADSTTTVPPEWTDPKVGAAILPDIPISFSTAADYVRAHGIDLVCLHLKPSMYGVHGCQNLALFARHIACPLVVIMHDISSAPHPLDSLCVTELEPLAACFVTMAHAGERLLRDVYSLPRERIAHIPHGAPQVEAGPEERRAAKERLGLTDRTILTTFGLLSPGKGIDDVIAALPAIIQRHPDVLYLVLGKTHPHLLDVNGETYRHSLERIVATHGLTQQVRFVDEYLEIPQLTEYLSATDIYVHAEHDDRDKIVSGSLAYAFAAGNVIVSTSTPYARELLAHRRGYLFPFRDRHALARRINAVLDDPSEFESVRQRAYAHSRGMTWESVGMKFVELFDDLLQNWPERTEQPAGIQPLRGLPTATIWENARLKTSMGE